MLMHKRYTYFGILLIKVDLHTGDVAEHMIASRVKRFISLQQGVNVAVMDGIWAPLVYLFIQGECLRRTYLSDNWKVAVL